jgi:Cof subfamily protein (haloacid dehalogenase superfamily)
MANREGRGGKISLLAFDLDGTLLNSSAEISEFTLFKIGRAMEKGVKVTVCSGRIPAMQQAYLSRLGVCGPYVACNGALVINNGDGSLLYRKTIAREPLERFCKFAAENQLHSCIQTDDTLYFSPDNPRMRLFEKYNRLAERRGCPKALMGELTVELSGRTVSAYKAMVYAPQNRQFEQTVAFLGGEPELSHTVSETRLFDIVGRGADKGAGIKRVAGYYGIPLEEVCAFGDYDNDLPLFNVTGMSVAMGNAAAGLKTAATFVTDTNRNGLFIPPMPNTAGCWPSPREN